MQQAGTGAADGRAAGEGDRGATADRKENREKPAGFTLSTSLH